MKKRAYAERYYITNGDKYLGCTSNHQFVIGVPVTNAKKFHKDVAEGILQFINDNNSESWCIQKYYNTHQKNNYVITNATKFVGCNETITGVLSHAKTFRTAAAADEYIKTHGKLMSDMGNPIIVNENHVTVDAFGREKLSRTAAIKINIDRNVGVKKIKRTSLSKNLRLHVYQKDKGICQMCGKPLDLENFTVDHIVPLNRGGVNDMNNYRCLCNRCNKFKGDSLDEELITMMEEVNSNYLYKHPSSNMMNKFARVWLRGQLKEIRSSEGGG